MKLIYRGYIYDYTPAPLPPYCPPRALNWRYQLRGEQYECKPDQTSSDLTVSHGR